MAARILNDTPHTKTNNRSSAKLFDYVTCGGVIIEGSENVIIETLPAARFGHRVSCKSRIIEGSNNTFINNKAAARYGDKVG